MLYIILELYWCITYTNTLVQRKEGGNESLLLKGSYIWHEVIQYYLRLDHGKVWVYIIKFRAMTVRVKHRWLVDKLVVETKS